MLHNVRLVCAGQQCKSAISIQTSPLSWASFPLTPSPLNVITEHQSELPVLYNYFPLAVCFTHSSVYVAIFVITELDAIGCTSGKEPACQCRRHKSLRFDSWVEKIPWRRACQPTPVGWRISCLKNPMHRGA